MVITPFAAWMLAQEARALLTRLARVKPFALIEPMLPAAALQPGAQRATERYLVTGRRELRALVIGFLAWLGGARARRASAAEAQRRFTLLRLKFNAVLTQFDLFSDVISQRSEHGTGVWLCGLDVAATDALAMPGVFDTPPLMCYLDRGAGAAIRRARTRLPGGGESPVAIIRVPRERMVGSGIASSLVHEVGHQASALLDLATSLRPLLQGMQRNGGNAWRLFERWIGEILSDFWSCARLGISATLGLMSVVGLPRPFMFRLNLDDPHPTPWIRVRLSCAMGMAMYPASAVATPGAAVGAVLPAGRARRATAPALRRAARGDAGLRRPARQPPPAGVARSVFERSARRGTAPAGATRCALHGVAARAGGDVTAPRRRWSSACSARRAPTRG